jgi:hypothetical protein
MGETKQPLKAGAKQEPKDDNAQLVLVTDWAVGRPETPLQVALRLNDGPAFILQANDATALAAALQSECLLIARRRTRQRKP